MVFLYFSRSAQQNRRGSNSLPGIPRMAEPFAGTLPLPLDLTRFALVEAASSTLPAAFQKENTILTDGVSFCDYPQVLLFAPSHIARKGECEGGTFDGFPHLRSITRPQATDFAQQNRRSKKKNHPKGGFSFCNCPQVLLFAPSHIARKGECEGETFAGFPTRVQSSARRRPLLHSKSATPKKKRHTNVCLFFFGASDGT